MEFIFFFYSYKYIFFDLIYLIIYLIIKKIFSFSLLIILIKKNGKQIKTNKKIFILIFLQKN